MNLATESEMKKIFQFLKKLLTTLVGIFHLEATSKVGSILKFNQKTYLYETSKLICSMFKTIFMFEIDHKTIQVLTGLKTYMESLPEDKRRAFDQFFYMPSEKNSIIFKIIKNKNKLDASGKESFLEDLDQIYMEASSKDYSMDFNKNKDVLFLLILLGIYSKNTVIIHSSIKLSYLIHNHSKLMEETLSGMQLVSENSKEEFNHIKKLTDKLNDLAETCEKWFMSRLDKEQQEISEILVTLKNLLVKNVISKKTTLMMRSKSTDELEVEEKKAEENKKKIHPIFRDRINCAFVATNSFQQNFFRNTGIIKSLIKILEWDLIYHQYLSATITKKLLTGIYEILGYCCQRNEANKKFLLKYLDEPFFMHFHSEVEVGASAFINHLISNNNTLL